jgi:hypothetical protein
MLRIINDSKAQHLNRYFYTMKYLLKFEALALCSFFTAIYAHFYPAQWGFFFSLFFVPDISFGFYIISKKLGTIAYNLFHHQGFLLGIWALAYYAQNELFCQIGIIFLAHSTFDRIVGYGLKYSDSFDHTHLGWIGKSKHLNKQV